MNRDDQREAEDRAVAKAMRYGIDAYSRYEEVDGERYAIEPYPYRWHPWLSLKFRISIVRWHIGIMRQHGLAEWNRLRKF